jgi:hypothetical protein
MIDDMRLRKLDPKTQSAYIRSVRNLAAYLGRSPDTAIANSRLIAFDAERVTFRWKDYRTKEQQRYKTMALDTEEFIRRFLIHVLPRGFHRIRHYGWLANSRRRDNLAIARLASATAFAVWRASDNPERKQSAAVQH